MQVTRVTFTYVNNKGKSHFATCEVVLDDSLILSGIRLCRGSNGYYLTFPSKQDVYRDITRINEGTTIIYPSNIKDKYISKSNSFEEFFHPVKKDFYDMLLNEVLTGFNVCVSDGVILKTYYKPK